MAKQLLRFEISREQKPEAKTKIVNVFSTHSGDYLGFIHWRPGWRCYVMSYANGIDMSLSCNKELNNYLEILEEERKKENETKNKN